MDLRLEIVGQGRQDPRQDSMDAEIQNEFLSYIVDLALNRVQVLKMVLLLYIWEQKGKNRTKYGISPEYHTHHNNHCFLYICMLVLYRLFIDKYKCCGCEIWKKGDRLWKIQQLR